MGGRRRLAGGFQVVLPDHRSVDGVRWRRYVRAGLELLGRESVSGSDLLRSEVERYAMAALLHDRAARFWAELLAKRETGKGRRPSERRIERAARRVGLADMTLKETTARLETLAKRRKPGALDDVLAAMHEPSNGAPR
jgi:hypothetical protein